MLIRPVSFGTVLFLFITVTLLLNRPFDESAGVSVRTKRPLPKKEEKTEPTSSDDASSEEPTISIDYARSHSQQLEEQTVISEFFFREGKVLTKGTFIEIGALDGNWLSNTWLLENDLSWFFYPFTQRSK